MIKIGSMKNLQKANKIFCYLKNVLQAQRGWGHMDSPGRVNRRDLLGKLRAGARRRVMGT